MDQNVHIRVKAVLEVIGKPREFVETKLAQYIEKIKEDENLIIVKETVSPIEEQGKLFSTFAEMEVAIKGISNLVGFCVDYMPSSVEILKPEEFNFPERTFTEFINDLLAKLHTVDMITKQLGTESRVMKENFHKLLQNFILVLIKIGGKKIEGIAKVTGVDEKEIKRYLDELIKDGKVKEKDGYYNLV